MSIAARNHLGYGYLSTRLGVVRNVQPVLPVDFTYYTHHPPLLPAAVSVAFALFGENPLTARAVSVGFSLSSLVLVYLLATEVGGRRLGLLAAFFFALLPMTAFYGQMANQEAATNCFALASALLYVRWYRSRSGGLLALSLGALALGAGFGWPAYYLAGILPLHYFVASGSQRLDRRVLWYPVLGVVLFALNLGHLSLISGRTGVSDLASAFLFRALGDTSGLPTHVLGSVRFSWLAFVRQMAAQARMLFTLPVLLLAALALWDARRYRRSDLRLFPVFLLLFGVTHILLFTQGAWEHDYWAYYCGAPAALLAASGLISLARHSASTRVVVAFAALFVASAAPEISELHRTGQEPTEVVLGRFLRQHTSPDELILTNDWQLKSPQVQYYASRDNFDGDDPFGPEISTVQELEHQMRLRPRRRAAVVLSDQYPGAEELGPWLSARWRAEDLEFRARRYQVFHLPVAQSGSETSQLNE